MEPTRILRHWSYKQGNELFLTLVSKLNGRDWKIDLHSTTHYLYHTHHQSSQLNIVCAPDRPSYHHQPTISTTSIVDLGRKPSSSTHNHAIPQTPLADRDNKSKHVTFTTIHIPESYLFMFFVLLYLTQSEPPPHTHRDTQILHMNLIFITLYVKLLFFCISESYFPHFISKRYVFQYAHVCFL